MENIDYKEKYLKYKLKYFELKELNIKFNVPNFLQGSYRLKLSNDIVSNDKIVIVRTQLQNSGLRNFNEGHINDFLRISQLQEKKADKSWTTKNVGMKDKENYLNTALLYFGLGLHLSKLTKDNFELYQRVLVDTRNFNRINTDQLIQSIKNKEPIKDQFLNKTGIFSRL